MGDECIDPTILHSHNIDAINDNLTRVIIKVATQLDMYSENHRPFRNSVSEPWFDRNCSTAKKELQFVFNSFKSASYCPVKKILYLECKKRYSSLIDKKKRAVDKLIVDDFGRSLKNVRDEEM